MTWRERIQAARERGGFSPEDRTMAVPLETCAVGENVQRTGVALASLSVFVIDGEPEYAGVQFLRAVHVNDFAEADRILNAIEDRALALKREQA